VAEINAKGGLLGKQLELIQYDTQSDIANFPKYAKKLILEDQVVVIHGGITSASRRAFAPSSTSTSSSTSTTSFTKAASATSTCSSPARRPPNRWGPLAKYALKKYGTKAYTVAADYNFGHTPGSVGHLLKNGGGLEPVPGAKKGQHVGKSSSSRST
jgi:branched-chain amino acid transport system substrate-binding protein